MTLPTLLLAHAGQPLEPHDLAGAWTLDLPQVIGLILLGGLYARGLVTLWRAADPGRGVRRWEAAAFAAGWLTLALTLVSPLHAMGEVLFSAHMAQHTLLTVVVAPLLVLGRPLIPVVWALPSRWRRRVGDWSKTPAVRGPWRALTHPLAAWLLYAVITWSWHAPRLYEASLTTGWVHAVQHVSFLGAALLFWWPVLRRDGGLLPGIAVLYLFTTMLHTGLLGAFLTFSPTVWYSAYYATTGPWGLTPLQDQELAGLLMWIPGSIPYVAVALALLARWFHLAEQRNAHDEHLGAPGARVLGSLQ